MSAPKHESAGNEVTADGIVHRCSCGWVSPPCFSNAASSCLGIDHRAQAKPTNGEGSVMNTTPPMTDAEFLAYIERTPELAALFPDAARWLSPHAAPYANVARAFHAHEQRVREELTRQLFSEAAHIAENAGSLAKIPGMTDEARCRELCAVYLKEAATYFRDTGRLDFASTAPQLSTAADRLAPSPEGAGQGEAAEAVGLPKLCPACGADTAFVSAFARTLVYRKTLLTIPDMEQTTCDSCAYTYQTHGQHDRNISKIKAAFLAKQGGK